jgi:xanthine/uracil/vitamin C permease (AzgA family)
MLTVDHLIYLTLVAFIFSIILPTYHSCLNGRSGRDETACEELAWYVALASNFATGIILLLLCVFGEFIRRNTPAVALLSSISGIGFTYLALNEYLPVAASPIVAFIPFAIVMLGYFSEGNVSSLVDQFTRTTCAAHVQFGSVPCPWRSLRSLLARFSDGRPR